MAVKGQPTAKYARGRCLQMCPASEVELRLEHRLVHRLELNDHGNPKNLVKEFRRSAAGHNQSKPDELRPSEICLTTSHYLITSILAKHELNRIVYHFVFDRLRSIRQDLIVQGNPDPVVSIKILQICVRFHLLASYKLGTTISNPNDTGPVFEPDFNFTQLLECLKALLVFYEDQKVVTDNQIEASAIYLLLNLGSHHSIVWGLNLRPECRLHPLISRALNLNWLFLERNFVGFFKKYRTLPLVIKMAAHWNFPHIFRSLLAVMNSGFSSKACKYPLETFMKLSLISQSDEVRNLCLSHNIQVQSGDDNVDYINFLKSNFNTETKIPLIPNADIDLELTSSHFEHNHFFLL